jgi:hypothetical protein
MLYDRSVFSDQEAADIERRLDSVLAQFAACENAHDCTLQQFVRFVQAPVADARLKAQALLAGAVMKDIT